MGIFDIRLSSEYHHLILHIRIIIGMKFHLKTDNFNFPNQIYPKKVLSVENGKNEHRHSVLYI